MSLQAQPMTIRRGWRLLDRRLTQGAIVIAAFVAAAALAVIYRPGHAETGASPVAPAPTMGTTIEATPDGAPPVDGAAREHARQVIAETLNRQAAARAASIQAETKLPQSPSAPLPSQDDFKKLADKATQALHIGDIAGARLVLERAVAIGDKTAIYALAETYDPRVLTELHVRGMTGDPDKARALYEQALAAGVSQAKARLGTTGP
ncbi:MAG TPA: hypothetical protein VG271_15620 [Beijerinckiaceae bacterium]|nr:hypothetical protein [Beijerinckiaceae bacterium]